jgi:hypothetical protein
VTGGELVSAVVALRDVRRELLVATLQIFSRIKSDKKMRQKSTVHNNVTCSVHACGVFCVCVSTAV